jgi:hypothetical protein
VEASGTTVRTAVSAAPSAVNLATGGCERSQDRYRGDLEVGDLEVKELPEYVNIVQRACTGP